MSERDKQIRQIMAGDSLPTGHLNTGIGESSIVKRSQPTGHLNPFQSNAGAVGSSSGSSSSGSSSNGNANSKDK